MQDPGLALSMAIQQCIYVIGQGCNRDLLQRATNELEKLEGESSLTKRAREFLRETSAQSHEPNITTEMTRLL